MTILKMKREGMHFDAGYEILCRFLMGCEIFDGNMEWGITFLGK
jgi:hypothetical protein